MTTSKEAFYIITLKGKTPTQVARTLCSKLRKEMNMTKKMLSLKKVRIES